MNNLELVRAAIDASKNAHCPYSDYSVGAAILCACDNVYVGCNFENASYGLSICAERNAIGAMVVGGCKKWKAIAIVTKNGAPPCGACLQVLSEFATDGNENIILANEDEIIVETTLASLFPTRFSL